jgi:3-hexulose-6-phosphate synthase
MAPILLQIALDTGSTAELLYLAQQVSAYVDWFEVGTPWILRDGIEPVRLLKTRFPQKTVLADMKIVDGGYYEACLAFTAGADLVTVLGVAGNATIREACAAARERGAKVVADLIQARDPVARALELAGLGVDYICAHTAFDDQKSGINPLGTLSSLAGRAPTPIMAAGGIGPANIGQILTYRPAVVVVGSALTQAEDPSAVAARLKNLIERAG